MKIRLSCHRKIFGNKFYNIVMASIRKLLDCILKIDWKKNIKGTKRIISKKKFNPIAKLFDIQQQWKSLQKRALILMDSKKREDLETAKELLLEQSNLDPFHPFPLYNIACVEALLGNTDSSLQYLESSLNNGYKDIEHIESDDDLKSIRQHPKFPALINKHKDKTRGDSSPREMMKWRKWSQLQEQGITLLEQNKKSSLEQARELFLEQSSIFPKNPSPYYHLSCIESELGNIDLALEYLNNAVKSGFKDFDQIEQDNHLRNIKKNRKI